MLKRLLLLFVLSVGGGLIYLNAAEIKKATYQFLDKPPKSFFIMNVGYIVCESYSKNFCGMKLKNCQSIYGSIKEINCATNVIEINK